MNTKLIFLALSIFILLMPLSPLAQPDKPVMNLEQLIEEAVQNNPEILAVKKRWEVFKEKVPQARTLPDPMFGFGIISLPTNFSFRDEDMTMKEISISQMFPFYGKRKLMGEMAENEAEAVSNEIQEKTNRFI